VKTPSIITIGELLVDWVCQEPGLKEPKIYDFKLAAGGAPANVAVALATLGYPVNFMGGVSEDLFGKWLFDYLKSTGVGTDLAIKIPQASTRQSYVFTEETGNRILDNITSKDAPDSLLQSSMLPASCFTETSLVYFGSVMQSTLAGAKSLDDILQRFPSTVLTIYDPNVRLCLWTEQKDRLTTCLKESAKKVDILKLSDNELHFLSDKSDLKDAARAIFEYYQPSLLVVTMGEHGAFYISSKGEGTVKSFTVASVEMTGAGDGFVAGLLGGIYSLAESKNKTVKETALALTPSEIESILREANGVGALATTQPGATAGLPTKAELKEFLSKQLTSPGLN
jgi:sugar/nucleoside kinase (ribokinase family)